MKLFPLSLTERAQGGFTHLIVLKEDDFTVTTAATGQVITLLTIAIGMLIARAALKLSVPFEDTADSANNTMAASLGDSGTAALFATSTELNKNGTVISYKAGTGTQKAYIAADTLLLTVAATASGKNLAALNKGELHVLVEIVDLTQL